ncbi:MAG: hypothetical protein GXP14_10640 [Gammaproteobacteria bacterium]|nr:hypothetical protein [Gammaproteobacteria bacterium]
MKHLWLLGILLVCLSLFGCGGDHDRDIIVASTQISTDSFVANIHITNGGGETTAVETQLRLSPTSAVIDLNEGDKLYASTIGPVDRIRIADDLFTNLAQTVNQIKLMTGFFADTSFPTTLLYFENNVLGALYKENSSNTTFTVSLDRPIGTNASDSNATLPLGFSIITPQSAMRFSRSTDSIMVSWNTIDNTAAMNITASLICTGSHTIIGLDRTLSTDTGNINIPAGTFVSTDDNCKIRILLDRFRLGTIDPQLAVGSQIFSHQKRFVEVLSIP